MSKAGTHEQTLAPPILSVIVCTHDRADDLRQCLEGLATLSAPVEVIVIDSASTPPVQPLVEAYRHRIPRLFYHYEERSGLSAARNTGIRLAHTDLIAFIDDDAAPDPDWAEQMQQAFANPGVGCVGGACLPDFAGSRPRWLSDRLLQFAGITRFGDSPREATGPKDYPFGANVCFRRTAISDLAPFPIELGRNGAALGSGEETHVIDALRREGWRVVLEPRARVRHRVSQERLQSRYYWRRLWWAGVSRAQLRRSPRLAARLLIALPIRLGLWAITRDRVYLYRSAETAGYLYACLSRG